MYKHVEFYFDVIFIRNNKQNPVMSMQNRNRLIFKKTPHCRKQNEGNC